MMGETTQALFDELAEERGITVGTDEAKAREAAVRSELRAREDLTTVIGAVLLQEREPHAGASMLEQHRRAVRIRQAILLVDAFAPNDYVELLIAARVAPSDVLHALLYATRAFVARAPEMLPRLLDHAFVGEPIIRAALAALDRDPARALEVVPFLVPLARAGVAADSVYPMLLRAGTPPALAAVRAAAEDASLPGDTRALALAKHPERIAIARALVHARTHSTSRELVVTVLRALEAGGLDEAFRSAEGDIEYSSFEQLGEAIVRWTNAPPERVDIGLVPMYQGVDSKLRLQASRDQQFVVGGIPVWAIRHYHWDDREDPNLVTFLGAPKTPVSRERLRRGPYLEGTLTVSLTRREAGGEHPFAAAWDGELEPPTLDVAWWHGELPGVELAVLPLGLPSEGAPDAYAWPMPGSTPDRVYLYAILLDGEATLARAVGPVTLRLIAPVATPAQRAILEPVFWDSGR